MILKRILIKYSTVEYLRISAAVLPDIYCKNYDASVNYLNTFTKFGNIAVELRFFLIVYRYLILYNRLLGGKVL